MIAYKFLRAGRMGPFSQFRWPAPGEWVRGEKDIDICTSGIHACRTQDLPWWLAEELWEIELDGQIQADAHKLVAGAGRLTSRIAGWNHACAKKLADACAWRARDRAVEALRRAQRHAAASELASCATIDDLLLGALGLVQSEPSARISLTIAADGAVRALSGNAPTSAYIAAHAALRLDGPSGYAAERTWQSRWLVQRLELRADAA